MNVADFIAAYLPFAQNASAQTGLPTNFILSQSAFETGWGTSPASQRNNLFGISPGGKLASYADTQAGYDAYSNLVRSPRFAGALSIAGNGDNTAIAQALNDAGYSETPDYAARFSRVATMIDGVLGPSTNGVSQTGAGAGATPVGAGAGGGGTGGGAGAGGGGGVASALSGIWGWGTAYASRAAMVVVALILLAGAIFLLGVKTIEVQKDA